MSYLPIIFPFVLMFVAVIIVVLLERGYTYEQEDYTHIRKYMEEEG